MRAKGPLSLHTIRKPVKSIITELPKPSSSSSSLAADSSESSPHRGTTTDALVKAKRVKPSYQIYVEPAEGHPEFLVVRIPLLKVVCYTLFFFSFWVDLQSSHMNVFVLCMQASIQSNVCLEVEPRKLFLSGGHKSLLKMEGNGVRDGERDGEGDGERDGEGDGERVRMGEGKGEEEEEEEYPYNPLCIDLPYEVEVEENESGGIGGGDGFGGAQFDRSKRVLTVTLTVVHTRLRW
jgi:hypothetical protein